MSNEREVPGVSPSDDSPRSLTLKTVLEECLPWDPRGKLFMSFDDEPWTLQSRCMIVLDEEDEEDEPHPEADTAGLEYVIGVDAVQDIVENARDQVASVTTEQLLVAFLYYYDHDAFVELSPETVA